MGEFKTPTLSVVISDKDDAEWTFEMPNGVRATLLINENNVLNLRTLYVIESP